MEEESIWDENSRVFYTAESKYVKNCYKAINKDYEAWETDGGCNADDDCDYRGLMAAAGEMSSIMGEAIVDENLQEKLSGKMLYCWCMAMEEAGDGDNFYS